MADLKIGSATPSAIFIGSTPVKEVYLGATKLWPKVAAGIVPLIQHGAKTFRTTQVVGEQSLARCGFYPDGTIVAEFQDCYDPSLSGIDQGVNTANWYNPPTPNIGAQYWIAVSPTYSPRISLASAYMAFAVSTKGSAVLSIEKQAFSFRIYDAATGGNQVSKGAITCYAEIDRS